MAQHWLPVQGFDEWMEGSDLGVFGSNTGQIEKVSMSIVCILLLTFIH